MFSRFKVATQLVIALTAISCLPAPSQTNALPRAGFSRYGQGSEPLPRIQGMHLDEGQDRRPGEAARAYEPGEPSANGALVRWEAKKMPLHVFISPGIKLPEGPIDQLTNTRVAFVSQLLHRDGNPFKGLDIAPGWTTETNDAVADGIELWRDFENEGLFSYMFTDDPRDAQIMVFFVDNFRDASAPGGINVGGNTVAKIFPVDVAARQTIPQMPVIIELSTMVNSTREKMVGASAHEFGHALGIKAHSPYRDDIMYVDRVVDHLSPADKATIRFLYHAKPAYVM